MKNTITKICAFLVLFSSPAQAQTTLPTIVSVGDGDTLRIRQAGQLTTIRLGCIDAPETTQQPYGQQSISRLKQLLPIGTVVELREITRDRYGRIVAEIYTGKRSVNLQMVEEGQAVVYRQYLNGCSTTKEQYLQAQSRAIALKLGFWNQSAPLMPWLYRQLRSGKETSQLRCSDFKTQHQAQQVLNASPGSRVALDRDGDGVACESLPK